MVWAAALVDQNVGMKHVSGPFRPALATLAVGAFLLAGCSAGGSDADPTTTAKATTTTKAEVTTTTADGPSSSDLEDLLPAAADLGAGWKLDTSPDDGDNSGDSAIDDQCPEVAALTQKDDADDKVKAAFVDASDANITVSLSPSAEVLSDAKLQDTIDAVNKCTNVTITDAAAGTTTTLSFEAQENTDYGDQGIQARAEVTVEADGLPQPIKLQLYALSFRNGTVGVSITGTEGFDEATAAAVPLDTDILLSLAETLDQQVGDLGD